MSAILRLKLRPSPLPPMTANGYIKDILNAAAVIFQNVGTTNVRLFNGAYTVLANGGVLTLNVTEDLGSLDVLQLDVMFIGAGTNRLEILTLRQGGDNSQLNC